MLTQTEIAAKRHERTMTSRAKRQGRRTRHARFLEESARKREDDIQWLADLGRAHRQALESRRTNPTMSQHASKGLIGRVYSFFRRGR